MKSELTDTAYDALFAVMQDDMPRMWREIFPTMLAPFEHTGAFTITVTDTAITVMPSIGGAKPVAALGLDPGAALIFPSYSFASYSGMPSPTSPPMSPAEAVLLVTEPVAYDEVMLAFVPRLPTRPPT